MVSLERLKAAGVTAANLKKLFTAKVKTPQVERLQNLIRDRIWDGRSQNFRDYRIWAAIDWCYDAAYAQTAPILLRHLMGRYNQQLAQDPKNVDPRSVLNTAKAWGMGVNDLFSCNTCGDTTTYTPKNPTFFKVEIPIVKSYTTIRQSKLFNERNQDPFFKYEPRSFTEANRIKCDALTDEIAKITNDLDYPATLRQGILQQLVYGICLAFPKETWYVEEQEGLDGKPEVVREGIRYALPHPSRMFYDLRYPIDTINSDSGVEWMAFWRLMRYGDIRDSSMYYNKRSIPVGQNWWDATLNNNFFQEFFPCNMAFPTELYEGWTQSSDRDARASFYTTNEVDKAVFVTNMFMKLVPKRWGFGNYEFPVWFRFEVAADSTVIWAEPVPYTPGWYIGYDADQNKVRNASLALEIVPFQEHLGNVVSQLLLSMKQNLANVVSYDTEQIGEDTIKILQNAGENLYRTLNFVPFSSAKARRGQTSPTDAFHSFKFPLQNTVELTQSISTLINIMERLLVMSPQEIGQASSHEQSATELNTINQNTSTRVDFTGTFIDSAIYAWKRQLYEASMQYLDKDFEAQIGSDVDDLEGVLKDMGFTLESEPSPPINRAIISGKRKELALDGFSSPRDGPRRIDNPKIAQVMLQTAQAVASNPMLASAVGPDQFVKIFTEAARLAGAPKDFLLKVTGQFRDQMAQQQQQQAQGPQQMIAEIKQMLDQRLQQVIPAIEKATLQQAEKSIAEPAAKALQQQAQALQDQKAHIDQLSTLVLKIEQFMRVAQTAPNVVPPTAYDSMPVAPAPGQGPAPNSGMVGQ